MIFSGRSAARRVIFRPPGRIFARKSVFCYRTPDFVNGPFVTLCETVDLAPSDPFLNFSFPSYVNFREGENGDFEPEATGRNSVARKRKELPQIGWCQNDRNFGGFAAVHFDFYVFYVFLTFFYVFLTFFYVFFTFLRFLRF